MTYSQERYWCLAKAGLCVECKGKPVPGQRRCAPCASKCVPRTPEAKGRKRVLGAAGKRRQWTRRRSKGQCGRCGERVEAVNPRTGKRFAYCIACQDTIKALRRPGAVSTAKCGRCGETGHTKLTCKRRRRALLDMPTPYPRLHIDTYAAARTP
jgi:hypothetical protein